MKNLNIVLFSLAILILGSCSSSLSIIPDANKKTIKKAPEWFLNTPTKEGFKYQAATATSRDMQIAIDKATLTAANKLSGQMESEMNALVKRVQEETGLEGDSNILDRFSKTQEQIVSNSLKDYVEAKKEVMEENSQGGKIYRAYVLVEWDESLANQRILRQIKQDQELFDAMRATELFDEMETKVNEYRNRKN
tara:strand:+ start:268 stop:849 length:582 start_codon:yes stop_codon:yes gene_type:complete